ncbi:MAG: NAD-dependent epimerase/dehydratase family protein [Acutalibacteraceae bacterium]
MDVNVNGTKKIVELCLRHKVKKLVHTSSVHAIPEKSHGETITEVSEFDPKSVHGLYAKTKAAASQIVLNAVKQGLNASIVHPSGIIGPGDYGRTHLTQLVISYLNGTLTACVNGGYDFVDVRDVADGIISCVENGRAGECYILSNQFYTIQEVLDDLHEITGKRRLKSVLPLWFAKLTAPLAEVWYKMLRQPPLYTSYSLYTLESNGNFSHEKATQELGYHPRSMKDTLTDMAYWLNLITVLNLSLNCPCIYQKELHHTVVPFIKKYFTEYLIYS